MKKGSCTLIVVCFLFFKNQAHSQWVQTNGPNGMTVLSLAVSGGNIFAGTYGGGVFLSTDNGTSWNAVNSGITNTNLQSYLDVWSFAVSGSNIFAGTDDGVFLSTNNGASWIAVNFGLTNTDIQSLAVNDSTIFEGTNESGVFRSPLSEMIGSVMFSHNGKP